MDRTFKANGDIYYFVGKTKKIPVPRLFCRKSISLPVQSREGFTLVKRLEVPKQVNDSVYISFTGNIGSFEVYAGKHRLAGGADGLYDVTDFLKRGRAVITFVTDGGCFEDFSVTVKRDRE